jgi:hypothetical protein
MFRGIDAVMEALSGILAEYNLLMVPHVLSREFRECETKGGGMLFYTTLMIQYDFISTEDGSRESIVVCGEGMDSGDKSVNKAMSAAFKYAAFQAFCIPVKGIMEDPDSDTHQVTSRTTAAPAHTMLSAADDPWQALPSLGVKNGWFKSYVEGWIKQKIEEGVSRAEITRIGKEKFGKKYGTSD